MGIKIYEKSNFSLNASLMYEIILNFFYFSFFTIFIFQTGSYLSYKLKNKIVNQYKSLNFLFGIFFIGSIIVLINFILPTGSYLTYALLLIFFILSYQALMPPKYILKIILINLIVYPICLKMSFAYDAGLYHLGYMNTLRTEKIIFGLANIQGYGFSSFQEYIGSIIFTPNFYFQRFIIGGFLSFFFLFLDDLRKTKLNYDNLFFFFSLLSVPFLSRYFMVYTTLTDTATGLLLVIQFYFAVKIFLLANINKEFNTDNFQIFILLTFLCVAFKGSAVLAAVLFFAVIALSVKSFEFIKLIFFKNIFLFLLIFSWLLKNIIISGCLVFPITISCFEFFDWNASFVANEMSNSAMAWHRQPFAGWEPLMNSNWFYKYWIKTYDMMILSILFSLFLIFVFNFIFQYFQEKNIVSNFFYVFLFFIVLLLFQNETLPLVKNFFELKFFVILSVLSIFVCTLILYKYFSAIIKNLIVNYKFALIFFIYLFLTISLWFYNAPSPRFALGYFFCLFIFFGFFTHIAFNGNKKIFDYSSKFRISNLFFLYFFMIVIFSQSEITSTRYSVYNFFNNSFWTNKITYDYYGFKVKIPFDGNDVKVTKRKNYGFEPKGGGGQCWLVKHCYVGVDLIEYDLPFNYKKLKMIPWLNNGNQYNSTE